MNHKSLVYLKTQINLAHCQAKWMELIQRYPMQIEYKPGEELKVANVLSCLYLRQTRGVAGLDPGWPLLVMCNKNKGFPKGSTEPTQTMVLKKSTCLPMSTVYSTKR